MTKQPYTFSVTENLGRSAGQQETEARRREPFAAKTVTTSTPGKMENTEAVILRPPGAYRDEEKPPDDPYAPEVEQAILDNNDQPRSAEIEIHPGVTVTAGVRSVYFNFGGMVVSTDANWHVPANFER